MYIIEKRNAISDIVLEHLPKNTYELTDSHPAPHAMLVRSADLNSLCLPSSVLAIARAGAGTNNIPCAACGEQGVVVFNTPGANANAVKELVLCALFLASRDVLGGVNWAASLQGEVPKLVEKGKGQFVGPEIKGKTLGVCGLGAIGALVANDAIALGMEVYGHDPYISVDAAWSLSRAVRKEPKLEKLLAESDYITLHAPLTDVTREMINRKTLAGIKPGAVLLNFSRGELVNNADVLAALQQGRLSRYVTDFPSEELIGQKNVICIPHLGASTPESEENCAVMAARQLADYLERGNIKNSVNYPDCELPWTGRTRVTIAHRNQSNMVGQITAAIASEGGNISDMINKSRKELAYTLIDLDTPPSDKLLTSLQAIEGVIRVRIITGE